MEHHATEQIIAARGLHLEDKSDRMESVKTPRKDSGRTIRVDTCNGDQFMN